MTRARIRSARASATALFPEAVGPKIAMTSATEAGAGALEILICRATGAQIPLDAAVSPLQLLEHLDHGRLGGCGDAMEPRELGLVGRGREPLLVAEGVREFVGGEVICVR